MRSTVAPVPIELLSELQSAGVSSTGRLVLLALASDPNTSAIGVARSAPDQLASLTGLRPAAVRHALDELDDAGFIVLDRATAEVFVRQVPVALDRARDDLPSSSAWWIGTGFQWDPQLRKAPIASEKIRAAVVEQLGRVAS